MHFIRIFGGQVGVAAMTRFLSVREKFHSNPLGLHVQAGDWLTDERLRPLAGPAVPANFDQRRATNMSRRHGRRAPNCWLRRRPFAKARAGFIAAKSAYISDITAYARHSYQSGVPFPVRNFGTFGLHLTRDVFDFGRRKQCILASEAELAQAEETLRRLKEEVAVAIDRSYNNSSEPGISFRWRTRSRTSGRWASGSREIN
jgi:hypothetical protein